MTIAFLYNNLFDTAAITQSSQNASFPASNLQNAFRTKVWRTAGGTAGTANLVIDHGSAKAVTACALVNYNWTSAPGTLDLEFHTSDAWGGPDNTEALTWIANPDANSNPGIIIKQFASISKRYNRLNVVYSPGATPTDWDLGRIFLGTYFSPTGEYLISFSDNIIDPSMSQLSASGQEHTDVITVYREKKINFITKTYSQWQAFMAMINNAGYNKNIIVAFDYVNYPGEQTWYGKIKNVRHQKDGLFHTISLTFRESR